MNRCFRIVLAGLIAAKPAVILDASDDPMTPAAYWQRWPSIPAVANERVWVLPRTATFPGPYIDRALRALAQQLAAAAGEARGTP